MSAQLKPMDVYSEITTPFDIAAYCRGHKLSLQAVRLSRAITSRRQAEKEVRDAEARLEAAEKLQADAVAAVREKMKKDPV